VIHTWWWVLTTGIILLLYVPLAYAALRVLRRSHAAGLADRDRGVCLTFDDGPDPDSTPKILETLHAHGVHATFFVLGKNADRYPDLIAAIAAGGHEIGEHGFSHLHPWKSMPWSYMRDLVQGHESLCRLPGSGTRRLYRPTFGKANALTFLFVLLFRKRFVFWNVDPHDYSEESATRVAETVLSGIRNLRGTAIVLLHDGRTGGREKREGVTSTAVSLLCGELVRKGYQLRTVCELAAGGAVGAPTAAKSS
jgi:peptidoglycan-N-acetylglucosamine deacetylase